MKHVLACRRIPIDRYEVFFHNTMTVTDKFIKRLWKVDMTLSKSFKIDMFIYNVI